VFSCGGKGGGTVAVCNTGLHTCFDTTCCLNMAGLFASHVCRNGIVWGAGLELWLDVGESKNVLWVGLAGGGQFDG
jgi:hypothetical protein